MTRVDKGKNGELKQTGIRNSSRAGSVKVEKKWFGWEAMEADKPN